MLFFYVVYLLRILLAKEGIIRYLMSVLIIFDVLMSDLLDSVLIVLEEIRFIYFEYSITMLLVYLHSPGSGVSTETYTTPERISPIHTPKVEGREEQIQAKTSIDDVEAIKDILSEITDIR